MESLKDRLKSLSKYELLLEARELLNGKEVDAASLSVYAKALEGREFFAYASELQLKRIALLEKNGIQVSLNEHHSLVKFIYKDESLPSGFRFDTALNLLNSKDDIEVSSNCETLGLAGAIYKYRWYWDQKPVNLEKSMMYYGRGAAIWMEWCSKNPEWKKDSPEATLPQSDFGYTAINYAYMLEVYGLNRLETLGGHPVVTDAVAQHFKKAKEIREFILENLLASESTPEKPVIRPDRDNGWTLPTVIEALFGLRRYAEAIYFIPQYQGIKNENKRKEIVSQTRPVWEMRTFFRQMLAMGDLQNRLIRIKGDKKDLENNLVWARLNGEEVKSFLEKLTGAKNTANSHPSERLGLALSGGGFRASLFHIGTLAALAEANRLKDIAVISCVSGGSIIGAYYYLKLKKLLEEKEDTAITQDDYIQVIKEIERDFLQIVQKNIRMHLFSNLIANLKMVAGGFISQTPTGTSPKGNFFQRLFSKKYLRTHRLAELYDTKFYRHLIENREEYKKGKPLYMDELFIHPKGMKITDFETDNLKRINKIPQLVLNATSLNTGHNWQFTASWMGEPAASIQEEIDVKPRLRRMYYNDAPEAYRNFPLGYAVAASSGVPGIFDPLPMYNLYPEIDLQLVDGGVHDNQGIGSLIEQKCNRMIISDASGQMGEKTTATGNPLSVLILTDTIFQERIRELQFRDVLAREDAGALAELRTTHLKNGLQKLPVKWLYSTDPPRAIFNERVQDENNFLTKYGIRTDVQRKLSELRTDLDSFHDTEAYALMYSGYCQTKAAIGHSACNNGSPTQSDWNFLKIKSAVTDPAEADKILPLLSIGSKTVFKIFSFPKIQAIMKFLGVVAVLGVMYFIFQNWNESITLIEEKTFTVGGLTIIITLFVVGFFLDWLGNLLGWRSYLYKKLVWAGLATFMFFFSNFYLCLLNPFYNRMGQLKTKSKSEAG